MADKPNIIVKEGYLVKSPPQDKLMAGWHRRFFVLWSSGYMEYYSSSEKRPQDYLKTLDLNNCEDMVAPFPVGGRTFVIKIAISGKGKSRDYYFDCDSQDLMEDWVAQLAEVCGFTAVDCDEEDNYSEVGADLSPSPISPSSRSSFSRQMSPSPVTNINKPKLRPPLPPQKPLTPSPGMDASTAFEDPNFMEYSEVSPNFVDDIEEDIYDGDISKAVLEKLNRKPPPVWKNPANSSAPPPLPPTNQRRFTRSMERGVTGVLDDTQFDFPDGPPPPLPNRSLRDETPVHRKPLPVPPAKKRSDSSPLKPKKPKPATPPKKGRPSTPPGMSTGVDFRADLGSRLKQRRNLGKSWSEDEQLSNGTTSPRERLFSSESDTGSYVDCDPNEPQAYLDYQFRNSFVDEQTPSVPPRVEELPLPLPPRESWKPTSPPPLPSRTNQQTITDSEEEAPPIPRRHPHASGRGTLPVPSELPRSSSPNNALPLPPRAKSPSHSPPYDRDDDAPPVPVRGVESTRPPLNRPLSDNRSNKGPMPHPQRGVSLPAGAKRLPVPPPRDDRDWTENEDSIFEDVSFNTHKKSPATPPVPKPKKPQLTTENISSRPPLKSNKIPTPTPSNRELSPKPSPPPVSIKPKFPVSPPHVSPKPKATSPPPRPVVATKPKSFSVKHPDDSVWKPPPPQRDRDFRHKSPVSPTNPEAGKVLPEPSSFSEIMERRKKLADASAERDIDTRKKLPTPPVSPNVSNKFPRPPFHNGVESRKKLPDPPTATQPRNKPFLNDSEHRPNTLPSLGVRKKMVEPPSVASKKPPTSTSLNIARKPLPVKPVLKQLQNSELAACLQSGSPEGKRTGGPSSSGPGPKPPAKPKPLFPPRP